MRLSSSQSEAIKQESENSFGIQAEVWLFDSRVDDNQCGFTLVEMVMTMVIIGILAAVVAPRFFDNNVFQSRGFADQVQASLRYAQKVAVAQRRNVCVTFSLPAPSAVALRIASVAGAGSACDTDLISPAGDPAYVITARDAIAFDTVAPAVAPMAFTFNALGAPTNAPQTINIIGATNGITIEAVTGYVHSP